jgi:hypothetical protein
MFTCNLSFSQNIAEKFSASLDSFAFLQPQEKAYVHTDRQQYVAGEQIWFKAYVTLNEKLTILSKVLYIELIDNNGKLVEKKMMKLVNGVADGSIETKKTLETENYSIRAYTLWMLNFPEFIVEKKIKINSTTAGQKKEKQVFIKEDFNVAFYPEGGSLVEGIKNVLAFKAIDQNNKPVFINGKLINNKKEEVLNFSSMHDGFGKFQFIPKPEETYEIIASLENGKKKVFVMPRILTEGVVMSIDNSNLSKTFVNIIRTEKNASTYNNFILIAQINYQVVYVGKINIDEGLDAVAINKKNLPAGIMQITLFSEEGKPLAERLAFVANYSLENDIVKAANLNTQKRAKNVLDIDLSMYKNLNAAISITNGDADNVMDNNIKSTLLLSSDIKGFIYNPSQYFINKDPKTLNNLDLLMLTNGWRRYNVEYLMKNQFPILQFPFETSMSISGKVLESNGKSALKSAKVNLIINGEDSTKIMSQANTNTTSSFFIDNIDYRKAATVYYQGTNLNNKNAIVSVQFNPSFFDTLSVSAKRQYQNNDFKKYTLIDGYYAKKIAENIKLFNEKGKTLEDVVVTTKKVRFIDSLNVKYASDIFFDSDQTLAINGDRLYNDIWQLLRFITPGISIINNDGTTQVNFTRFQGMDFFSENGTENNGVQFFLNEVPVSIGVVETLNAEDIGLVKIFKGNTAIALGATRGAIALYTVKGKSTRDWRTKGFAFFKKLGYAYSKEFNEIDYSIIKPESEFTDERTTLYWNPKVLINDGKASVVFYNDDFCKKFKVIIEGIDTDGKLLYGESEFK